MRRTLPSLLLACLPLVLVCASVSAAPASTSNLNSIVMLTATDGWAVGDSGTTLHFDGSSWNPVPSGTSVDLLALSFGPPNSPISMSGFAVGGTGGLATAIHWDGVSWSPVTQGLSPPAAQRLSSVFEISSSDAWAVDSASGTIWHWSGNPGLGGGWSSIFTATGGLNSIFMTGAIDGWAVGQGGMIYHFTGGSWTLYSSVGTTLNSVFMLNENEGWAVGNGGAIYHYMSGEWNGPVSPAASSQDLRSLFMTGQSEGWAVGSSGTIVHYSNGIWNQQPPNLQSTSKNLNSIYFVNGIGWAVGDGGTIITALGQPPFSGFPLSVLRSVYLLSSADGWAVGCSTGGCNSGAGQTVVAHWNGQSFTLGTVLGASSDLDSVFMTSETDGWAVGGIGTTPFILHYGGAWTEVAAPAGGYTLHAVFMINQGEGWAVGDGGIILHYSGGAWGVAYSPVTTTLRGLYMLGSTDGWAVGDGGTILRYQGQWTQVGSPTGASLRAVHLLSSSDGWIVGSGGTVLHYDGTTWTKVATFATMDLNSVSQASPKEAWAVGNSGTILHWTGFAWYSYSPSPPLLGSPNLNSIFMLSNGYGLIVGAPPALGGQATVLPIAETQNTPITLGLMLLALLLFVRRRKHI